MTYPVSIINGEEYYVFRPAEFEYLKKKIKALREENENLKETLDRYIEFCDTLMED